jgi:hypothetical protein
MPSRFDGVHHVVHVGSDVAGTCSQCDEPLHRFEESVNHYIRVHAYRLLHVGSECGAATRDMGVSTVAVLGK